MTRPLYEIAADVRRDWKPVNYAAKPYLEALECLSSVDDAYGMENGRGIVAYFLSNATTWRGETARAVKAELKAALKAPRRVA